MHILCNKFWKGKWNSIVLLYIQVSIYLFPSNSKTFGNITSGKYITNILHYCKIKECVAGIKKLYHLKVSGNRSSVKYQLIVSACFKTE